jgi:hypothetical protein
MRKILFLIVISFAFFESCNTDFSINDPDHEDIYILNCILQNDNSIQYAILSKNICTESGGTPVSISKDQCIRGANIKILYNNSVFVMRDTTLQMVTDGKINEVYCYYIKGLIVDPGKVASIEATASNGKILKSTNQIPDIVFPKNFKLNISPSSGDGFRFYESSSWSWVVNKIENYEVISLPQLELYYKKYEGGTFVDKNILIPLGSIIVSAPDSNFSVTSKFVNVEPSYNYSTMEFFDILNTKMKEISGNDPNKQNYIIEKAAFSIFAIDPILSKYYSQYYSYSQKFSFKLYPPDYSNIKGGKGIFGMFYKFSKPVNIDSMYVHSFGYQYKSQ